MFTENRRAVAQWTQNSLQQANLHEKSIEFVVVHFCVVCRICVLSMRFTNWNHWIESALTYIYTKCMQLNSRCFFLSFFFSFPSVFCPCIHVGANNRTLCNSRCVCSMTVECSFSVCSILDLPMNLRAHTESNKKIKWENSFFLPLLISWASLADQAFTGSHFHDVHSYHQ